MTVLPKSLFAWLLTALIIATGGTLAIARGQTHIAGQIVVCVGSAVTTISVDENGQPVRPAHICPDCVLLHFAAYTAPAIAPGINLAAMSVVASETAEADAIAGIQSLRARGPPAVV